MDLNYANISSALSAIVILYRRVFYTINARILIRSIFTQKETQKK